MEAKRRAEAQQQATTCADAAVVADVAAADAKATQVEGGSTRNEEVREAAPPSLGDGGQDGEKEEDDEDDLPPTYEEFLRGRQPGQFGASFARAAAVVQEAHERASPPAVLPEATSKAPDSTQASPRLVSANGAAPEAAVTAANEGRMTRAGSTDAHAVSRALSPASTQRRGSAIACGPREGVGPHRVSAVASPRRPLPTGPPVTRPAPRRSPRTERHALSGSHHQRHPPKLQYSALYNVNADPLESGYFSRPATSLIQVLLSARLRQQQSASNKRECARWRCELRRRASL